MRVPDSPELRNLAEQIHAELACARRARLSAHSHAVRAAELRDEARARGEVIPAELDAGVTARMARANAQAGSAR